MRFLRRRLLQSFLALFLAVAGIGIKTSIDLRDSDTSVWPVVARSRSEFERVAKAINSGSKGSPIQSQRRRTNATRDAAEKPVAVEPKVFEIDYDADGNALGP